MNFRIVISLTALLLFAVNTALVISEIPPCPVNDDGTLAAYQGVPGWITCPAPTNYNCDDGKTDWAITGSEWIIQTGVGGPYVASSEGETLPIPGQPVAVWESFKADIIAETGELCGGRKYTPIGGYFSPDRSDNEDDYVMQGDIGDCYRFGNCNWYFCGMLEGWQLHGAEYVHIPQQPYSICEYTPNDDPADNLIWVPCDEGDGA